MTFWTSDKKIIELAKQNMWILCLYLLPDGTKGSFKAVIKALGLQQKCVVIHLVGNWLINVPLQLLLSFKFKMNITGLWLANLTLSLYILSAYIMLLFRADWEK